jgi:hypothetical protein
MKQTHGDKHTIAWFKIAECVSRGEKERALGVYRLLSHSFNDVAITKQLEADIHLSFGEEALAVSLYAQAMQAYGKSQRFLEAVAVSEHLIFLCSTDISFRAEAIKWYNLLGNSQKMYAHVDQALDILLLTGHNRGVQEFLSLLQNQSDELYGYGSDYIKKYDSYKEH